MIFMDAPTLISSLISPSVVIITIGRLLSVKPCPKRRLPQKKVKQAEARINLILV
jgi:hypothetical protein